MRWALLLLALPLAAQYSVPCEPGPETIRLLESVPPVRDTLVPFEQRVGALRALAEKHPGNYFIQRAYQDSFRNWRHLWQEFDRAIAMYRARKNDALAEYYEARLLMLAEPQRARKTLDGLLREHPEFVWAHRDAAEWGMLPGRRDDPELKAHAKTFEAACPEAWQMPVRAGLERRNTPLELSLWAELWQKEGASERIRGDLKRIEAWPFRADPELYRVYSAAARILKDDGVLDSLRAKVARDAPNSLIALHFDEADWQKANPTPDRNAPPEEWRKRQEKEVAAARERVRRWPTAYVVLSMATRPFTGGSYSGQLSLSEDDLALLDQIERARAMSPDAGAQYPPFETWLAGVYAAAKVRLDRVPRLLDAGLREIDRMRRYDISLELFPPEARSRAADWPTMTAERSEHIRADYLFATGRPGDARAVIDEALRRLDPSTPRQRSDRERWLLRLSEIDRAAAVKARGDTRPPVLDPPQFITALPEFSAPDLAGRVWQLRDLKGKATVVNYWATWCGPCRGEHPAVQELYERTKDRQDIQVLTFSVDDDAAAARAYMKEKGYTFPVIHGPKVADRLFPWAGLPTNFLVAPDGRRSGMRGVGWDSTSVARLIDELAKIAAR
jgi:thiol-disulfide isomerase/thioredoxin